MGGASTGTERRAAVAAGLLLALLVAGDLLGGTATALIPLLFLVPLTAAIGCGAPVVAAFGAASLLAALALGASADILGDARHLIYVLVVALSAIMALAIVRTRMRFAAVRAAEDAAYRRIALLDRSSSLIAMPMEYEVRLRELAALLVGDVADLTIIDLAAPGGGLEGIVAAARDPEMAADVERTRAASPIDPEGPHPVAVALRTGRPQLLEAISDEELARYATGDEHHRLMRRLGYRSAVVVPLIARGRTLGVLSVLRLGDPVPFDEADRSVMTDLAGRAAVAIDNARLFEERTAAESQLRAVIGNLAEAVTITGPGGAMEYLNQAAAELFGYPSPEAALAAGPARIQRDYELLADDGTPFDPVLLPERRVLDGEQPERVTLRRRHVVTGEERWLSVKASAVADLAGGGATLAVNVIEDITAERRLQQTSSFLSEASKVLASSLDFAATLRAVAEAAVPHIADGCSVDLLDEEGRLQLVALVHVSPEKERLVRTLREEFPPRHSWPLGPPAVARSGVSELHPRLPREVLARVAQNERHLELLGALEMSSALIVPMSTGERTIGTITFVTTEGARRLTEDDRDLAEELGRRAGVAVEHARIHGERSRIAETLQRSLLPPRLPVVPGLTLAARFRAAGETNEVGGDFYDMFAVRDGWIVVIGDVTGKGPGAAALTSLARYTLRTAALYEPDPIAMLRRLNDALLADGELHQMCTAACLQVTPREDGTTQARLVCAGHPPPYLLRGPGEIEEICKSGPLLGAFADAEWRTRDFELEQGAAVVLYTDGVTDARGAGGRFGPARLEEVLRGAAGGDADAIAQTLDDAVRVFQTGPQRDDVALLVMCVGAPTGQEAGETTLVAESPPVLR